MLNNVSRSGVMAGEGAMADMEVRPHSLFFVGDSGGFSGSRLPQMMIPTLWQPLRSGRAPRIDFHPTYNFRRGS